MDRIVSITLGGVLCLCAGMLVLMFLWPLAIVFGLLVLIGREAEKRSQS